MSVNLKVGVPTAVPADTYVASTDVVLTPYVAPAPTPTITGLTPNPVPDKTASQLFTVTGTGFVSGTVAYWNDMARSSSQVVSPTVLTFTTNDITPAGARRIYVRTPAGQTSNTVILTVSATPTPEPEPPHPPGPQPDTYFGGYRTAAGYRAWAEGLVATYPGTVAVQDYGQSLVARQGGVTYPDGTWCPGFPLWALRLGDPKRPALAVVAALHAREIATAEALRRMCVRVLGDPLLSTRCLYAILTPVPDALHLVAHGVLAGLQATPFLQRKALDSMGTGPWPVGRGNVNPPGQSGTDPDRNWTTDWGQPHSITSHTPLDIYYCGTGPASLPEIASLDTYLRGVKPGLILNLHAPAGWVIGTPGTEVLQDQVRALTGFPSAAGTPATGSMTRWCVEVGIPGIAMEMGPTGVPVEQGFCPPWATVSPEIDRIMPALMHLLASANDPLNPGAP